MAVVAGYYQAAETLRSRAIKAGIITESSVPETKYEAYQRHGAAQAQALDGKDLPSECPLRQQELKASNILPACRESPNDNCRGASEICPPDTTKATA